MRYLIISDVPIIGPPYHYLIYSYYITFKQYNYLVWIYVFIYRAIMSVFCFCDYQRNVQGMNNTFFILQCIPKIVCTVFLMISIASLSGHRWEFSGNTIFTLAMVIYHYVEKIWRIIVTPNYLHNI